MSTDRTLAESASQSTETLLHELKHYRCSQEPIGDLTDPYLKMLSTYRAFHNTIVESIESGDVDTMSLVREGLIDAMYKGIPQGDIDEFRAWIKLADRAHPLRRLSNQHLFLTIVRVQTRGEYDSLTSKVLAIVGECEDMYERMHNPESLVKDPDELYFFRNKNGIKDVPVVKDAEGACLICTEAFDDTLHVPQQGPCGHIICRHCFDQWLLQCSETYTCPMCRGCVVCGANPCADHLMEPEPVQPVTLSTCLDVVLPYKTGQVLHGFKPQFYWVLRELTRPARVLLAFIDHELSEGVDAADPAVMALMRERETVLERIKANVQLVGGHVHLGV